MILRDLPDDSRFVYNCSFSHDEVQQLIKEKEYNRDMLKLLKMLWISNGMSAGPAGILAGAMIAADIYNLKAADKGNGVDIYTLNNQPAIVYYQSR